MHSEYRKCTSTCMWICACMWYVPNSVWVLCFVVISCGPFCIDPSPHHFALSVNLSEMCPLKDLLRCCFPFMPTSLHGWHWCSVEVAGKHQELQGVDVHCIAASLLHTCRAFAVVETVASAYAIKSHHLYQLSPQQLISCDYKPGLSLDGCRGGSLKEAFQTIKDVSWLLVYRI